MLKRLDTASVLIGGVWLSTLAAKADRYWFEVARGCG
jgi:hypothetical protein